MVYVDSGKLQMLVLHPSESYDAEVKYWLDMSTTDCNEWAFCLAS